jgi:WD40 repeat protein
MGVKNLLEFVNDGSRFVRYFGMAVARSAPHIYVSALPFAPRTSRVFNQYFHRFGQTLSFERGQLSHWPALEMMIDAHGDWINSVAFSPDGQRIASASDDCTIRVWDAATGEVVAGPFTGHTNEVNSVAFSPDGQRIASASRDHTIRVWCKDSLAAGLEISTCTTRTHLPFLSCLVSTVLAPILG